MMPSEPKISRSLRQRSEPQSQIKAFPPSEPSEIINLKYKSEPRLLRNLKLLSESEEKNKILKNQMNLILGETLNKKVCRKQEL